MAVEVARLAPENFDKWESFRNILLVRTVSLIQTLSKSERFRCSHLLVSSIVVLSSHRQFPRFDVIRLKILQQIEVKEFKHDEYIVRQGEIGSGSHTCVYTPLYYNRIMVFAGEHFFIIQEGSVRVVND